jgi:hypothetical protein
MSRVVSLRVLLNAEPMKNKLNKVIIEDLMEVAEKNSMLWDVPPCSLKEVY